ncbi:MAG: cell division protein FtsX [Syntrophothermus sp.]
MSPKPEKYQRRKARASYVTSTISITLVLFMLGVLGLLVLQAKKLSDYAKENIGFSIMIKNDVKEDSIRDFLRKVNSQPFVKSTRYVTREQAAQLLKKELGEDFIGFLGYNPLTPVIDLHLKSEYADMANVASIERTMMADPRVKEVFYQKSLVELVNHNIRTISFIILGICAVLMIISIALINNTIHLSVYSHRFSIRTMQLVGATRGFIRRPFVRRGILSGMLAGIIAAGMLTGIVALALEEIPELFDIIDPVLYGGLGVTIILFGIFISWFSTSLAVRKYLKMKEDDLYH